MEKFYESEWFDLYNGNSSEVLEKIPENSVDLTVTSPPYDDLRKYNGYSFNFEKIAEELFRVTKVGGGDMDSWRCSYKWQ